MVCPSEDTYARFMQGLLGPAQTAELERHIDSCDVCADLVVFIGRSYASEGASEGDDPDGEDALPVPAEGGGGGPVGARATPPAESGFDASVNMSASVFAGARAGVRALADASGGDVPVAPAAVAARWRALATLEALLVPIHIAFTIVAWPLVRNIRLTTPSIVAALPAPPAFHAVAAWVIGPWASYAAVWAPLGGVVALAGAIGLARGRPWGRRLALWHGILSFPSVVLAPLALFAAWSAVRDRDRGPDRRPDRRR